MIDGTKLELFADAWQCLLEESVRIKRQNWQRWLYFEDGSVTEVWPSGRKTSYEPTVSDLLADDYQVETVSWPDEVPTSPGGVEITWVDLK